MLERWSGKVLFEVWDIDKNIHEKTVGIESLSFKKRLPSFLEKVKLQLQGSRLAQVDSVSKTNATLGNEHSKKSGTLLTLHVNVSGKFSGETSNFRERQNLKLNGRCKGSKQGSWSVFSWTLLQSVLRQSFDLEFHFSEKHSNSSVFLLHFKILALSLLCTDHSISGSAFL